MEKRLIYLATVVAALGIGGCRTVTVNEVPGGGPVYVNQSYVPDISPSLGIGDSAIKAAVDAYLTGTGISAAGSAAKGIGQGVTTVEVIKASKP